MAPGGCNTAAASPWRSAAPARGVVKSAAQQAPPQRSPRGGKPVGLRAGATIGFGVTGLVVALVLVVITYGLAREYLVDQQQDSAKQQTYVNARLARAALRAESPDVRGLVASLGSSTSDAVLRYGTESFSTSVSLGPDAIPAGPATTPSDYVNPAAPPFFVLHGDHDTSRRG